MAKKSLWQRFKQLTYWNKIQHISGLITILGLPVIVGWYFDLVSFNSSSSEIQNKNIYVVLPVVEEPIKKQATHYSPEEIIRSVRLDSFDQTKSSKDRILARSVNGFYYSTVSENIVLFSGITPFKLESVGATFDSDYRLLGHVTELNKQAETVKIEIKNISMIDNYGNAFEIKSKNGGFIGYAESLGFVSQGIVKVMETESGFHFDHSQDVQIILNYSKDDVEIVNKI